MINKTKRLIEALQKSGYKVRYEKTTWGRGFRYKITGIGRANYKYSENAYKKGLTLVTPKRHYTMSDKVLEQRKNARESKKLLKQLTPEEKELYTKIRKLYKSKEHVEKFKRRHKGSSGKAPSIQQILKINPARRLRALQRRYDELQGNANIDDMEGLASALEEAGRITGVDVYDLVAKLRSGDYTMSLEEFKEYSSILKDSNNANYWRKQIDPEKSINEVVDKLTAFFNKK